MLENWKYAFLDYEPIAHLLIDQFPSRWVRFHSLPGSKRYPNDESEYTIVLGRLNSILGELVADGGRVILLTTEYSGAKEEVVAPYDLQPLVPEAERWRIVRMDDQDEVPNDWIINASEWSWTAGVFDQLFRLVADVMIANVMIVDPDCRWMFHPYDGGMDVILESTFARDSLRSAHPAWLSTRLDGR